jgi:hypothetical protein
VVAEVEETVAEVEEAVAEVEGPVIARTLLLEPIVLPELLDYLARANI